MKPRPGDLVLYWFSAYVRHGSPDQVIRNRPAIVTSVLDGDRVNLHVFFEPADHIGFRVHNDEIRDPNPYNIPPHQGASTTGEHR